MVSGCFRFSSNEKMKGENIMKNLRVGSLVIALVTLLVLMVSTNVLADTLQNEYLHNGTGQIANDLEKWLVGNVGISFTLSKLFSSFSYAYDPVNNVTKLRWYNGTVAPCQSTNACFCHNQNKITHKYLPRWSFNGVPNSVAGAALSHDFVQVQPGLVNMTIANTPVDGGPATVGIIQVGVANTPFSLETLTWEQLENIPWAVTINNIHLNLGGSLLLPPLNLPTNAAGLVYRARIWLDSDPTNVVVYTGEYLPTLSGTAH